MKFKILALILLVSVSLLSVKVSAASDCIAPYFIPNKCQNPYIAGQAEGYTADLNCQLVRITQPGTPAASCCPNICVGPDGKEIGGKTNPKEFQKLEVFGTTIKINPDNIGTIINILFTTVLGIVSLYAIFRGIYVTGVKRPLAITADQIAEINKELTNLIIGVIICWGFIIVIQVIANLLGVGQLNNLDFSSDSSGTVITIQ